MVNHRTQAHFLLEMGVSVNPHFCTLRAMSQAHPHFEVNFLDSATAFLILDFNFKKLFSN